MELLCKVRRTYQHNLIVRYLREEKQDVPAPVPVVVLPKISFLCRIQILPVRQLYRSELLVTKTTENRCNNMRSSPFQDTMQQFSAMPSIGTTSNFQIILPCLIEHSIVMGDSMTS